jgi:nucleoside-diphosphate-sugar epimerase
MSPGEQLIDLVYVDDVVDAFMLAAERLIQESVEGHECFAVSSGKPIPLKQLVDFYCHVTRRSLSIHWGGRAYRIREVMVPWTTGNPVPGWDPKVTLEEGILLMERLTRGCLR